MLIIYSIFEMLHWGKNLSTWIVHKTTGNQKMKHLLSILLIGAMISLFYACEKEKMGSSSNAVLHFSSDTITFDTLFTTIGSPTRILRAINKTNENLVISSVRLAGGKQSGFRLNVNGDASNESYNVQIPAQDSIFIFVEALLGKNGGNIPLVTEDSIIFTVNNIIAVPTCLLPRVQLWYCFVV